MFLLRRQNRRISVTVICILIGGVFSLVWQNENKPSEDTRAHGTLMHDLDLAPDPSERRKTQSQSKFSLDLDSTLSAVAKRRTPKVYIYPLPDRFNSDIKNKGTPYMNSCLRLNNGGFGDFLYQNKELKVYGTPQFALEVIIHNQLLHSKYRTKNPEDADIFYIPFYSGTYFFSRSNISVKDFQEDMFKFVNTLPYFKQGKPHLSTLAKIEREQADPSFPSLKNPLCRKVTYIVIEKEANVNYRKFLGLEKQKVIVAPYPSYVHLDSRLAESQTINAPDLESRTVFMLLAAGDRRTNPFRNTIVDQLSASVKDTSFTQYRNLNLSVEGLRQIWLKTLECSHGHENITTEWMQNSIFCLQPHGDSPTRKSFYDSIVSGCIPVIFTFPEEDVVYPFQRVLNYSDFIVSIDAARVEKHHEFVLNILKDIPHSEIVRLHSNVVKVARMLQYSFIDEKEFERYYDTPYVDALDMIMDEVKYIFGL